MTISAEILDEIQNCIDQHLPFFIPHVQALVNEARRAYAAPREREKTEEFFDRARPVSERFGYEIVGYGSRKISKG